MTALVVLGAIGFLTAGWEGAAWAIIIPIVVLGFMSALGR
mgnify:CR=1 FL=1